MFFERRLSFDRPGLLAGCCLQRLRFLPGFPLRFNRRSFRVDTFRGMSLGTPPPLSLPFFLLLLAMGLFGGKILNCRRLSANRLGDGSRLPGEVE
jgi:hypothetical protein